MSSPSDHHDDDLPSAIQDTVGKNKSRVKFTCLLCGGSHQIHLFPCMEKASKLLEDMTISQPQISVDYHSLDINPPVVDGMINSVPSLVSQVYQLVNLVTSLVEPVDKVVDTITFSVDPTLPSESETQVVDMFPSVDPSLPFENATQVVDLISSLVDPTLSLESKLDTAHIFIIVTKSTMLGGMPPSPVEPPPSNEAIRFDWGSLTRPRLPSHIPFNITIQVCGRDIPKMLIDKVLSVSIFSSIVWQYLDYLQLVPVTQNLLDFNRRTSQPLGTLPQFIVTLGGKNVFIDVMVVQDPLDLDLLLG
jgi:hypothetical protein